MAKRGRKKQVFKVVMPYKGFYFDGKYYSCQKTNDGFVFVTTDKKAFEYAKSIGGVEDGEEMDTADRNEERSTP